MNPKSSNRNALFFNFLLSWAILSLTISQQPAHAQQPASSLRLEPSQFSNSQELVWHAHAGHVYFIQQSRDLRSWEFTQDYVVGSDEEIRLELYTQETPIFFRLRYSSDPESELLSQDLNESGLKAWDHIQLGYNPFVWVDTTGSGIHDAWKTFYFGTLAVDADADSDGDGLSNLLEFYLGTNPLEADVGVTGPSRPRGLVHYSTNLSAFLKWSKSIGIHPVNQYRVYRDGQLVRTQSTSLHSDATEWTDTGVSPGTTYNYELQARDNKGNWSSKTALEVETASAPNIPDPWEAVDVGVPTQGTGKSAYYAGNELFVLTNAGGGDVLDTYHFVNREFTGDFRISAYVHMVGQLHVWTKGGLLVTEEKTSSARGVAYSMAGQRDAQIQIRKNRGGGTGAITTPGVHTKGWLRIDRQGDTWIFSTSQDGVNWLVTGEEQLALPQTVFVGMAVAAGTITTSAFSDVQFEDRNDSDGDGLTDAEELVLGTAPHLADTDGDGFSDYEEKYILFSDPLVDDIGEIIVLERQTGPQRTGSIGQWAVVGETMEARDERGGLDFTFEVEEAGVYRLSVELTEIFNPTSDSFHSFNFTVDGEFVDRVRLKLSKTETGFAQVITPYLQPGVHSMRMFWDNTLTYRRIAVHSFEVHELEDLGWVGTRTLRLNGLLVSDEEVNESFVSPFMVEGWSRHFAGMEVLPEGEVQEIPEALEAVRLPGDYWKVDWPLNPDGAVEAIEVSMEYGALRSRVEAQWVPLDLFATQTPALEEMSLRAGDSLKLSIGESTSARTGSIQIERVGQTSPEPAIYDIEVAGDFAIHEFLEPGEYVVSAEAGSGSDTESATLSVKVFQAALADDLVLPAGTLAPWSHPELGFDVDVEFDSRLVFGEITPIGGARSFSVGTNEPVPRFVAARLPDGSGVLDTASVEGLRIASSLETSQTLVDIFPDGTELIRMPVVVSNVVPGMKVTLRIAVSGITFADGSLVKVLDASDFDALGRAMVEFLRSGENSTASCYTLELSFE